PAPPNPACGPTIADSATAGRPRRHRESPKESASSRLRNRRWSGPSCRRESARDRRWWPPWHRNAARPVPRREPGSRMASGSRRVVGRARTVRRKLRRRKSGNRALLPGRFVKAFLFVSENYNARLYTETRRPRFRLSAWALATPANSPEHAGEGARATRGYGLVLAISGTAASPLRLGCCGPRWYRVSASFRNSKLSSGESDILNRLRSGAEIVPASTRASKLTIFFQYALP